MSHRMYGFADKKGHFDNIHESRMQVRMCGGEPIVALTVEEDPDQNAADDVPYWGWEDVDKPGTFCMIFHHRKLLQVCFAYGIEAAVEAGKGRPVHLLVTENPDG
jgi:hypothetical protein